MHCAPFLGVQSEEHNRQGAYCLEGVTDINHIRISNMYINHIDIK